MIPKIIKNLFSIPFFSKTACCFFALFLLAGCVQANHIAERERLKPLRIEAQAGNSTAFKKLEGEALRGVPEAENQMGSYYASKYFALVEDDPNRDYFSENEYPLYKKALEWWQRAAEHGNAPAAYNLGIQHEYRIYFPDHEPMQVSDVAAARWYRLAAELGDSAAMVKLWNIGYRSEGNAQVAKRLGPHAVGWSEAYKWLHLAAEHGEPEAIYLLSLTTSNHISLDRRLRPEEGFFWRKILLTYYADQNQWTTQPSDNEYGLNAQQISLVEARVKRWRPKPMIWPKMTKKTK